MISMSYKEISEERDMLVDKGKEIKEGLLGKLEKTKNDFEDLDQEFRKLGERLKEKDRNFAAVKGELAFLQREDGKWEKELFKLKQEKFDLESRVDAAMRDFNQERVLVQKLGAEGISREILIKELECRAQDLALEKSVLGKKLAVANSLTKSVLSVDDISLRDELKVLESEVERLKSQKSAI